MKSGDMSLLTVCLQHFSGDFHLVSESQSYLVQYMPGYILPCKPNIS